DPGRDAAGLAEPEGFWTPAGGGFATARTHDRRGPERCPRRRTLCAFSRDQPSPAVTRRPPSSAAGSRLVATARVLHQQHAERSTDGVLFVGVCRNELEGATSRIEQRVHRVCPRAPRIERSAARA